MFDIKEIYSTKQVLIDSVNLHISSNTITKWLSRTRHQIIEQIISHSVCALSYNNESKSISYTILVTGQVHIKNKIKSEERKKGKWTCCCCWRALFLEPSASFSCWAWANAASSSSSNWIHSSSSRVSIWAGQAVAGKRARSGQAGRCLLRDSGWAGRGGCRRERS